MADATRTGPWTGDPIWLADVLRAGGVRPVEYPGWRDRGHGDFSDIPGSRSRSTSELPAQRGTPADGERRPGKLAAVRRR